MAKVTRGGITESLHAGHVAVSDAEGRVVMSIGDASTVSYMRSASKPIQAVPVVSTGAFARFGFTSRELAIMTASHSGEPEHVSVVRSVLAKIGLDEQDLHCGTHAPFHQPTAEATLAGHMPFAEVQCNCSGKHSAMLALAVALGLPPESYWDPRHPVQQLILDEVSQFTGIPRDVIHTGIDGCGVPVFAVPLRTMAMAYARLVTGEALSQARAEAGLAICRAMMENPFMVAGTGRVCTQLMEAFPHRLVAKSGAEGVYCMGLPELGLGVAIKVQDGSSRAMGPVCVAVLQRLGVVGRADSPALGALSKTKLCNLRGEEIGDIVSEL